MSDEADMIVEPARPSDVPAIRALVDAAYVKYIQRIGKPPAPMLADYRTIVAAGEMHILKHGGAIVGAVQLVTGGATLQVGNLVVDPAMEGRGLGRRLMDHAEGVAREKGLSTISLYTNAQMHENIAFYGRLGFAETGRSVQDDYDRVFFRKGLA